MTTYQIVADTARTFGLRNKTTGQIDHGHFATRIMIREFFKLHYSWNPDFRLEG